jgi:hypothetical protein
MGAVVAGDFHRNAQEVYEKATQRLSSENE